MRAGSSLRRRQRELLLSKSSLPRLEAEIGGPAAVRIRPDRVAIYIRWSTIEQEQGTTYEVQLNTCIRYVQSQGWTVNEQLIFVDAGHTGTTLDRPALSEMRRLIAAGEIDCVVTYRIDRLARSHIDILRLIEREWQNRCVYRSATEPIDTSSPTGRTFLSIVAVFAEHEVAVIADRLSSGRLHRIAQGEIFPAQPPLGYMRSAQPGRWEIHPEEHILVKWIYAQALLGRSPAEIAEELNRDGRRTRRGARFDASAILRILRNPAYRGAIVFGRTVTRRVYRNEDGSLTEIPRRVRQRRPEPEIVVEGSAQRAVPEIIPPAIWEQVQQILDTQQEIRSRAGIRGSGNHHLLVGIARCPNGNPIAVHSPRAGYAYYVCARMPGTPWARRNQGEPLCDCSTRVPVGTADHLITAKFLAAFGNAGAREQLLAQRARVENLEHAAAEAALSKAEQELRRRQAAFVEINEQMRAAGYSVEDRALMEQYLRDELERAREAYTAARERLHQVRMRMHQTAALAAALAEIEQWETLDIRRQRQLLQMALRDPITLQRTPDGIRLHCHWEGDDDSSETSAETQPAGSGAGHPAAR